MSLIELIRFASVGLDCAIGPGVAAPGLENSSLFLSLFPLPFSLPRPHTTMSSSSFAFSSDLEASGSPNPLTLASCLSAIPQNPEFLPTSEMGLLAQSTSHEVNRLFHSLDNSRAQPVSMYLGSSVSAPAHFICLSTHLKSTLCLSACNFFYGFKFRILTKSRFPRSLISLAIEAPHLLFPIYFPFHTHQKTGRTRWIMDRN